MSANAREWEQDAQQGRIAEPLYVSSGDHDLFAWLHTATVPPLNLGLVICKPFGYEALCSHRSVRKFAEAAADLGVPTLRFDYVGTGDSADIDPTADQIETWVQDVLAAVAELRRRTGVRRVCLLGIRLGALLAVMASAHCSEVAGLFLVAPVVTGKRYLRELRTARLASLLGVDAEEGESSSDGNEGVDPGSMEFSGYPMSAATMNTLAQIDLTNGGLSATTDIHIVDRTDLPGARAWAEALSKAGNPTQYSIIPGFVEMALVAPQFAVVPRAIMAVLRDYLLQVALRPMIHALEPSAASDTTILSTVAVMSLPGEVGGAEAALSEGPVSFGSGGAVFGIVTRPRSNEARRRAVILLNAGADYHMGAGRMYVSLARLWARRGYFVLRMDLMGIGDSGTRPGRSEDDVFPPSAIEDIRAATDFMCDRYGICDMTLTGLCSGAYHALRAAAAGLAVNRILMINPQNYFWKEGMSLQGLQLAEVVHNPSVYRERISSLKAWKRLLTGRVNVWRIVKIYFHRPLLALEAALRDAARHFHIRLRSDLGWDLEEIGERGVRIVFVFARGEPGIDLLKIQGGSTIRRLGARCGVRIIDSADHTFSRSGPRGIMEKVLSDELFACHTGMDKAETLRNGDPASAP